MKSEGNKITAGIKIRTTNNAINTNIDVIPASTVLRVSILCVVEIVFTTTIK